LKSIDAPAGSRRTSHAGRASGAAGASTRHDVWPRTSDAEQQFASIDGRDQKSICGLILKNRGCSTEVGVNLLPFGLAADGSTNDWL
jgi:hypothetical protein